MFVGVPKWSTCLTSKSVVSVPWRPAEAGLQCDTIHHASYDQLSFVRQVRLPLTYMVQTDSIRRLVESNRSISATEPAS